MDRTAILLNLRDLRDLELAKICVARKRQDDWQSYQREIDNLSAVQYMGIESEKEGAKTAVALLVCGIVIGAFIALLSWFVFDESLLGVLFGGLIIWGSVKVFGDGNPFQDIVENSEIRTYNEKAYQHNKAEQAQLIANQPQIVQLQQSQRERDAYWRSELQKVGDLLDGAYAVNLVPMPYRYKFAAIQYIYEYMSTSSESLGHVLLSTQIKDGIRRIEAKLDIIISQQNEMIFQMHRQEAQNRQLMDQNEQMLLSLHRTEANTLEAAQYAQLSASYNKTCAFFAIANYLEK